MSDHTVLPETLALSVRGPARQPWPLLALASICAVLAFVAPTPVWRAAFSAAAATLALLTAFLVMRQLRVGKRRLRSLLRAGAAVAEDPSPCFLSGPDGTVHWANAVAQTRLGDLRGKAVTQAVAPILPNAAALVFRHETTLGRAAHARETVVTRRGHVRVSAHRIEGGALWRLDEVADRPARAGDGIGLPMMIASQSGTVLSANEALRDLLGDRPRALSDVFTDLPVRSGERVRITRRSGPVDVMVAELPAHDGRRELYLLPSEAAPGVEGLSAPGLDAFPVALMHISAEGTIRSANRMARHLLGGDVAPGTPLTALLENLGRPVEDWLADTLAERIGSKPEVLRAKRAPDDRYVQVTLGRLGGEGGPSLVAVLHDATELKTMELQFVQSQKMQAVGELAGGVAHDFNNVLTAISGHCDLLLLRHDQGDPDYADLVQINQNANRAAALVGQLLAFSRKQTLKPELIDLRDALAELTHLLNRLVGERVTLTLEHDSDLMHVRADRRQLEQVLMNLVVNARDAMPDGGSIAVTTRTVTLADPLERDRAVVPDGCYVVITVTDTGHGIPADKLTKIFEPFWTTKRTGEGTGLGLSMAYGIVKQSGGYIFVDSMVGQGSTFSIYLPAHAAPEIDADAVTGASAPSVRDTLPERAGGTILLVEDEAPVRAFASRALRLRGYEVHEAACAEEALETLKDGGLSIDLFLTDVIMPGMDGPTWVQAALADRPGTKVIFVSGYAEDCLAGGGPVENAVFLPKPFSLTDLTRTVAEQLH